MKNNKIPAIIALENGTIFHGKSIGSLGYQVGEIVFNTSMTGYQEILTDPSYAQQIIALTYPHIGNVGTNTLDCESNKIHATGLITRDASMIMSSWRGEQTLPDYLISNNIQGIAEIDTRKLTRILRDNGAQNGCIMAAQEIGKKEIQHAIELAKSFKGLKGLDLAKKVSTKSPYQWNNKGTWTIENNQHKETDKSPFNVIAYDFGIKKNILRKLNDRGCNITVVPAQTPASEILSKNPDGIFLSNGPGDPSPCTYAIDATKIFLEKKIPIFGICLGMQILSLASNAKSLKMKFGHHGANHPVEDLDNKRVYITSQNHGFAIDEKSLPNNIKVTHRSLFDNSLQGIERTDTPAFAFQGHPEASPGPNDIDYLFDYFIELMQLKKENK